MLLSRFWYLFLGLCAAGATGAAMLGQGIVNDRNEQQVEDALRRDRQMAREVIRLEARTRIDKLAFAGVDREFGAVLRRAKGVTDERKLAELSAEARKLMSKQASRIAEAAKGATASDNGRAPDLAFGLDADGRIIAQLGPMTANPPGASLASYPLVRKALDGFLRDDIWLYDRKVYRMAARPVVSGGHYAGAVLHGYKLTPKFAEELSMVLGGAAVGFFHAENVFVLHEGDSGITQGEIAAAAGSAMESEEFLKEGKLDSVPLSDGARASFEVLAGSTAPVHVGLLVARPLTQLASPMDLFDSATEQDVAALPKPMLAILALIAFAIGMGFMFLEHDKPLKELKQRVGAIGAGEIERLVVTEWRGRYRNFAMAINDAIDKEVERMEAKGPRSKKKADLDQLLGPTPEEQGGANFFGFANESAGPAASAGPAPSPEPLPPAETPAPAPASTPAAAPPAAPKAPPPPGQPAPPGAAPPAPPTAKPAGGAPPPPPATNGAAAGGGEEAHFRETFEQYVATRKECGEPTDSLTFEKFSVTLNKTRDQIVSKHGGKSVRFTVYVKAGKAALKAAPVK